jgi:P27 family predicted phage terminase small subunit
VGKRGPAPKPTALRLLHGDQKSRVNLDEPIPDRALPDCPDDVSDEVREIWDYTVEQIDVMGMASKADRDSLRCYCEAVVAHRKASALLAKSGVMIKATEYTVMRNPAFLIQRDAAVTVCRFAQQFGLTPAARSEIRSEHAGAKAASAANPFGATGS